MKELDFGKISNNEQRRFPLWPYRGKGKITCRQRYLAGYLDAAYRLGIWRLAKVW
jgi:hypothetical protein